LALASLLSAAVPTGKAAMLATILLAALAMIAAIAGAAAVDVSTPSHDTARRPCPAIG